MPHTELWAGALSLLLRHGLTGCTQSALQAADLLGRIAEFPDVDNDTRMLCEQASLRLTDPHGELTSCRPCQH